MLDPRPARGQAWDGISRTAILCAIDKSPKRRPRLCALICIFLPDKFVTGGRVMKSAGILVLILCAWCASVAWGQQTKCKANTPWAEFHRFNMRRSNPCEKALNVHNVGNLGVKWSYTTGSQVNSSPTVASGVVYIGSDDHNVYALYASTGAKMWSYATGSAVKSSPAVANGVVYVGSDDGNLYALNARTGAKLWSYPTTTGVESPATVANGVVYVGSSNNNVYALNAKTGAKLWSYTTGGPVFSSPAVASGVVYVG